MSESDDEDDLIHRRAMINALSLLLEDSADVKDPDTKEAHEWFAQLSMDIKAEDASLTVDVQTGRKNFLVPQMMLLLRESLLTHRWSEVATVLSQLIREPRGTEQLAFKVGLELFHQGPQDGSLSVPLNTFIEQTRKLIPDVREVAIEYALFLLDAGHLHEAKTQLKSFPTFHRSRHKKYESRFTTVTFLLRSYEGMVWYIEWLQTKHKTEQKLTEEEDGVNDFTQVQILKQSMKPLAQRAIECFNQLTGTKGVWDIFITKHVQLLEYYEEYDRGMAVLQDYVKNNPDNPNAHRYLYEFYSRHGQDIRLRIDALQQFCDLIPSDAACLELYELLLEIGESPPSLLYLLFDLLDFSCWQCKLRPWTLLSHSLVNIVSSDSSDDKNKVQECWDMRVNWWPSYHFSPGKTVESSGGKLLNLHKAIIALMLDTGSVFVEQVKSICTEEDEDWTLLQKAVKIHADRNSHRHLQSDSENR